MQKIELGKINNSLKASAYHLRNEILGNSTPNKQTARHLENFLELHDKCPTKGRMAIRDLVNQMTEETKIRYYRNAIKLEDSPETDSIIKNSKNKYQNLYPKTGYIRKKIIDNGRITFDKVTPKLKSALEKFLIRF